LYKSSTDQSKIEVGDEVAQLPEIAFIQKENTRSFFINF